MFRHCFPTIANCAIPQGVYVKCALGINNKNTHLAYQDQNRSLPSVSGTIILSNEQ